MRSVLVIEDDRPTHALFIALVRRCGFEAISAFDGPAALGRMREERPDAIILDLLLPTLNGFQILSEIRRFAPDMLSTVVVVTAAAESLYRGCTELESVHAILRKPFKIDQLEDLLRRMLKEPIARENLAVIAKEHRLVASVRKNGPANPGRR
jgi:DNA-binding response OmpR family regulator